MSQDDYDIIRRSAINFYLLSQWHKGKVKFFALDEDVDAFLRNDNHKELRSNLRVPGSPSFVLYSVFDVVNNETAENNDGQIKLVDVFAGGPKNARDAKVYRNNQWKWIKWNCIQPLDKPYTYRYEDYADSNKKTIGKIHKVFKKRKS